MFSPGSSEAELQEIAREMMAVYSDEGEGGVVEEGRGGKVEGRGRESTGDVGVGKDREGKAEGGGRESGRNVERGGREREGKVEGGERKRPRNVEHGGREREGKVEGGGRERGGNVEGGGRENWRIVGQGRDSRGADRLEGSAAGVAGEGAGERQKWRKSEGTRKPGGDHHPTKRPKQKSF